MRCEGGKHGDRRSGHGAQHNRRRLALPDGSRASLFRPPLARDPVDPKKPSVVLIWEGSDGTDILSLPLRPFFGRKQKMLPLKRSFLAMSSLIAVAAVMQVHAPAQAQVAKFDPRDYGTANLVPGQSTADASTFIAAQSGGAFEPIGALR